MSLTRSDVEKVAILARLQLSDQEVDRMTDDLSKIVAYIDQLSELDTTAVEPLAHAIELSNVFRSDVVRDSLPRESALGNAPNADDQCFRVPAVLGE